MKKSFFITLDGIEGVGKTTQIKLLENYLKSKNKEYISTREPGGFALAESIRALLLSKDMCSITELLLYEAARSEHINRVVKPALDDGKTVICDRFIDSTLAYQGYGRGINLSVIDELNKIASHGIEPDLTIILDLTVEQAFARMQKRNQEPDRIEKSGKEFFVKAREGFLNIAKTQSNRVKIVNADQPEELIHAEIIKLIEQKI